ncbi:Ig-like domain-containing protein, partial [Candidatus Gottesmanbacteria bacterium]|nr:Ig-like domain-containing protein [Candidatus Gottesmanbacteria bacterium]
MSLPKKYLPIIIVSLLGLAVAYANRSILIQKYQALVSPKSVQATTPPSPEEMTVKLMVINYDPVLENYGNKKVHEYYNWNNPVTLTNQLIADYQTNSHGNVKYELVEWIERDEWPVYWNGKRLTDEGYVTNWGKSSWDSFYKENFWNPTGANGWTDGDYMAIINDNGITEKVNSGKVDEVWMWGFPGAGWCESRMAGSGSYWVNCPQLEYNSARTFIMMGFNYERGMAEAMESYAHRTENIINRAYDYQWAPNEATDWNKFTLQDWQLPGRGGLGNAHNAFNAEQGTDYNRSSTRILPTTADDWYNFPNMTGATTNKNCTAWGCDGYEYLKWWHDHMPHVPGLKGGILNNWWRYIIDVNEYKAKHKFDLFVEPETDYAENNSNLWSCWADGATCTLTNDTSLVKRGSSSLKYDTTAPFDSGVRYPAANNANWNLTGKTYLTFWAYVININSFQDFYIRLKNANGSFFEYRPTVDNLDQARNVWKQFIVPLAGDDKWTRTTSGSPSLSDIDQIEIHADTWNDTFIIYFDGVGFSGPGSPDATAPTVSITSPASNANVSGIVPVTVAATDGHSAMNRVELYLDGNYYAYDALGPYVIDLNGTSLTGPHALVAKAYDIFNNVATSPTIILNFPAVGGGGYDVVDLTENNASDWEWWTEGGYASTLTNDTSQVKVGSKSVKFDTTAAFDTYVKYPKADNANWNLSGRNYLTFWAYAINNNTPQFQGPVVIYLRDNSGNAFRYESNGEVMNQALNQWHEFVVPLTGDAAWIRTTVGSPNLSDIDYVEIHNDTWGVNFTIYFDGVNFMTDYAENNTSSWSCWIQDEPTCSPINDTGLKKYGANSVKFDSQTAAYDTYMVYPGGGNANWNVSNMTHLQFWAYAVNNNFYKFQSGSPWIFLKTSNDSYYRYKYFNEQDLQDQMNEAIGNWKMFEIPLAGDSTWIRTPYGNPSLTNINQIEIHDDTWDAGFSINFDGVGFVNKNAPPIPLPSPTPSPTPTPSPQLSTFTAIATEDGFIVESGENSN